jgi:hypothetical protein
MTADSIAFALVMALHHGHNDEASRILCELDHGQTAAVAVLLAMSLDQSWTELCEYDGVPFEEFAHHAGQWLAERAL